MRTFPVERVSVAVPVGLPARPAPEDADRLMQQLGSAGGCRPPPSQQTTSVKEMWDDTKKWVCQIRMEKPQSFLHVLQVEEAELEQWYDAVPVSSELTNKLRLQIKRYMRPRGAAAPVLAPDDVHRMTQTLISAEAAPVLAPDDVHRAMQTLISAGTAPRGASAAPRPGSTFVWPEDDAARALLPPGWRIAQDPASGSFYFFNAVTGSVQWGLLGIDAAGVAAAATAAVARSGAARQRMHAVDVDL